MVTSDRRQWQVQAKVALVDFAVSPADPRIVVAATERGPALSTDAGRGWRPIPGPKAAMLDWQRPDALWVMTADGQIWQSSDAGKRWLRRGKLNGQPRRSWFTARRCMPRCRSWASCTPPTAVVLGGRCIVPPCRPARLLSERSDGSPCVLGHSSWIRAGGFSRSVG